MLEAIEWKTNYRGGLYAENDASEFLRLLIKKIVGDLKLVKSSNLFFHRLFLEYIIFKILQRCAEFQIQRLAADPDGDPIFEITLEAKSQDDLLKIMKDTARVVSTK